MIMTNIIISPSQQSWNKCAMGDNEADHTYEISKKVRDLLREYDCNVTLIPRIPGDENYTLGQVVTISNNFVNAMGGGKSYHLDIHTDAGGGKGASGFYMSDEAKGLITQVWREVSNITPWGDGNITYRNLYVLKNTTAVAGLIELSFHDDITQSRWIHGNVDLLAKAIAKGIVGATGIKKKESSVDGGAIQKGNIDLVAKAIGLNSPNVWYAYPDANVQRMMALMADYIRSQNM